ncbi:sugar transferase [Patiriisocius hiemis]|uniref:Sugar transferase n=1 Tax=Patiriisocius hiemis TaxID=3075604 RepID=A0ABU2YHA8_9FLAO|nr:sugar transferase [Constantimarinum sp. W242]MDT0556645.1 sugar transferase [Constantimarinum sp. W242]
MYRNFLKPLLDFFVAIVLFVILLPCFIVIVILLTIVQKTNPFFLQKRPGKHEKIFSIIKFKTMNNATDNKGDLLPDNERITGLGKFVRSTSLDEIPQLLNVIKGDMSIVGPRPLLPEYLPLYNEFQKKRHQVKPGITGYAQVNGRNAISWEKKFEFDIWYVNNQSFMLDFKILLLTLKKVFVRENITAKDHVTTTKFTGNL